MNSTHVASVVAEVTDTRWGQVLITPYAYAVVEIASSGGDARRKGVGLLSTLAKELDTTPISLDALIAIRDRVSTEALRSLILLVREGATLYLVSGGEGRVFLKRGEKLASLLEGDNAISGTTAPGDTVIAATAGFAARVSSGQIMAAFHNRKPQEVAEYLTMLLHQHGDGEGSAALIFEIVHEESRIAPPSGPEEIKRTSGGKTHRIAALGAGITGWVRILYRKRKAGPGKVRSLTAVRMAAYVLAALFIISVVLGIRYKTKGTARSAAARVLAQAQYDFDEGMALLDLNPVRGRERLAQAKALLEPLAAKNVNDREGREAKSLYDKVTENLTLSMRSYSVEPELFYDTALLKKDTITTDMSLFDDVFGLLDGVGGTVFSLAADTKNGAIVGGGEGFAGALRLTHAGEGVYVFAQTGIHAIRMSDRKTTQDRIPKSSEWGVIADMEGFGGNIYLLDTQKGRIWKYVATQDGFSEMREYLNPDYFPDLGSAVNMAIDGSVWVGTSRGKVYRFTGGKENQFVPQGAEPALGQMLIVYTSDAAQSAYILDTDNHRVVVFDKDGLYLSQYVWEAGFRPTQFIVTETLKKIFLLADGKIYSVGLK